MILLLGGFAISAVNFSDTGPDDSQDNLTSIKIGHVPHPLESPIYTGAHQGIFREAGFDVEVVQLPGPEISKSLVTGEIDYGIAATGPITYQRQSGLDIKAIAMTAGFTDGGGPGGWLIVREGTNISSAEDLRGKTVATCCSGSLGEIWLHKWAEEHNMTVGEDFTYTTLGDEMSFPSAFESGEIDAAYRGVSHPTYTKLRQKDLVKEEPIHKLERGDYVTSFLTTSNSKIQNNPEQVRRFVEAYKEAAEHARENPEDRIESIAAMTSYDEETLRETQLPRVPADLTVDVSIMRDVQGLMHRYDMIEEEKNMSEIVDNSFIEEVEGSS